jgi:hypothetical protein
MSLFRLLNMGPRSQNWVPILPVWPMAPLPLHNEYQFPQLGAHWIWQFNCWGLNPRKGCNSATEQFQLGVNANQFPQYNEANSP